METKRIAVKGSGRAPFSGEKSQKIDPNKEIEVTVRVRRKQSIEGALKSGTRLSHKSYAETFGSAPEELKLVEAFGGQFHLTTVEAEAARRSVMLTGTAANMEAAFGVKLFSAKDENGNDIHVREGEIFVPAELGDIIVGVFGLDTRPIARAMFQVVKDSGSLVPHRSVPGSFKANQLASIYGFPSDADGTGETIAILELGGGFRTVDLNNYFGSINLKTPSVKAVSVDGGKNKPSNPNGADGEVMLDIEVAGSIAPGANFVVYFTKNTDKAFLDGITKAIHDEVNKPSVLSISWGGAEVNWTEQAMTNFNEAFQSASLLGVTVCIAAGDSGSSDGVDDGKVHVDFPASSPYVLACGGTSLKVNGNALVSEVVWHDSPTSAGGGGVSEFFPVPDYQSGAKVPVSIATGFKGRGVPDVAGDADPNTGYQIIVDGEEAVIGGTSAVAPLYAGLIARINQKLGKSVGFINPQLYADPTDLRDIVSGNNKTTSGDTGYEAGPGYDACSGLGVFSGAPLLPVVSA